MKVVLILAAACLMAGCASSPVPYDKQFSTLDTVDKDGVERSHAWVIKPSARQSIKSKWGIISPTSKPL